MRNRSAFTLVEVLVVVAILGLLASVLMPAVQNVRAAARRTECKNGLRQIGVGIHMFANTNSGRFPFNTHKGAMKSWIYTLAPYMENVDQVRLCPDDAKYEERLSGTNKGTSYIISNYVSSDKLAGAMMNLHKLQKTTTLAILFEVSQSRSITADHAHVSSWYSTINVANGTVWQALEGEVDTKRHHAAANYLFADGHVDTISAQELSEIVSRDIAEKTCWFKPK